MGAIYTSHHGSAAQCRLPPELFRSFRNGSVSSLSPNLLSHRGTDIVKPYVFYINISFKLLHSSFYDLSFLSFFQSKLFPDYTTFPGPTPQASGLRFQTWTLWVVILSRSEPIEMLEFRNAVRVCPTLPLSHQPLNIII